MGDRYAILLRNKLMFVTISLNIVNKDQLPKNLLKQYKIDKIKLKQKYSCAVLILIKEN